MESQTWNIEDKLETMRFTGQGAINVDRTMDGESAPVARAVTVNFNGEYAFPKKDSLLALDFQNDPGIFTGISGEHSAHICANAYLVPEEGEESNLRSSVMAIALDLQAEVNLKITTTKTAPKIPSIIASANGTDNPTGAVAVLAAIGTGGEGTSTLDFSVPSQIIANSIANGGESASSAAVAIGNGYPCNSEINEILLGNVFVNFAGNSVLKSNSNGSFSSAVGIGVAIGVWDVGDGASAFTAFQDSRIGFYGQANVFLVNSAGMCSATAAIGSAISGVPKFGGSSLSGDFSNIGIIFDSSANVLRSTSSGIYYSAAVGIGSAIGLVEPAIPVATFAKGEIAFNGTGNALSATSLGMFSSATVIGSAIGVSEDERDNTTSAIFEDTTLTFGGSGNVLSAIALAQSMDEDSNSYGSVVVVGSAVVGTEGNIALARGITVNANGSQTFSALAFSDSGEECARVTAFGADTTDKREGDANYGWRVGFYAEKNIGGDSVVNIIGAKLSGYSEGGVFDLSGSQGSADGDTNGDCARAFALGNDFQIYFGGKANEDHTFSPVSNHSGKNTANIIGAIGKARTSTGTANSSLSVGNGWTVNAFGPIGDLETLNINALGCICLHGMAKHIGSIVVSNGGTLEIGSISNGHDKFTTALDSIGSKLKFGDHGGENADPTVGINGDEYPWKGDGFLCIKSWDGQNASPMTLELREGGNLLMHVGAAAVGTPSEGNAYNFGKTHGLIFLSSANSNDKILFNGGKIYIAEDNNSPLPAKTNYWLIGSDAEGEEGFDAISFANQISANGSGLSGTIPGEGDEIWNVFSEEKDYYVVRRVHPQFKNIVALDPDLFDLYLLNSGNDGML
jgi:hypothetical protein